MISVIQRVSQASVTVHGETIGRIGSGLLSLTSVAADDDGRDIEWTVQKLISLRIFRNGEKHFDQDVREVGGAILVVSNFTVASDARRGRRPSFDPAAPPQVAEGMFKKLVDAIRATGIPTETGRFAADMLVSLVNDGPATFIINSRDTIRPRSEAQNTT
ncbi:MAG TPA: D-aminoacyl-tRNA deacylase [Tepidisphaeraceae bacterium]|jgi:D-tyrosyl-tRNA(Tyr) deacylase